MKITRQSDIQVKLIYNLKNSKSKILGLIIMQQNTLGYWETIYSIEAAQNFPTLAHVHMACVPI